MRNRDDISDDGLPLDPVRRKAAVAAQFDDFKAQVAALTGTRQRPSLARRVITTVDAASHGECERHCRTRRAFLECAAKDSRCRDLFARWRHDSQLDLVVTEWSAMLDAAATRAGLSHRSAFHHDAAAYERIAATVRAFLAELEVLRQHRTAKTLDARTAEALRYVRVDLFNDPRTPVAAWLGLDLLDLFDAEVIRDIWGETEVQLDVSAETLNAVEHGRQPKHDGEHQARDGRWLYRSLCGVPRATIGEIAREYREDKLRRGEHVEDKPKGYVRKRIQNAKRLLELTIPPERWAEYLQGLRLMLAGTKNPPPHS